MNNIALRTKDLRVTVGTRTADQTEALRGVSLEVRRGERVAIIGRSGGGKSTLMRVFGGLVSPTTGSVEVSDQVVGPGEKVRRDFYDKVGLVFQNYGLVPQLSALQNVLCGRLRSASLKANLGQFTAEETKKATELLQDLGLGDRLQVKAARLSGGEQQRVAIARLLYQAPEVMLLDEPVASLDVHWAALVLQALTARTDDDTTVVMVLHDLWMARQFADRVVFIQDGKVAFDGDPEEACRLMEARDFSATDGSVDATTKDSPRPPAPLVPPGAPSPAPADVRTTAGLLRRSTFYALLVLAALSLYVWSALGVDFSLRRVFSNLDHAVDFIQRMTPPDLSVSKTIFGSLVETLQMALIGTTLAAVISLPIAVMAARNISPLPVQAVARLILNLLRTVPSIIWGLFFVAIVGLGPFPGILALTFYAAGYLGKFYYEGIESIDPRPLQSLKTVGASPVQMFRWGVFPQVLPLVLGYTLYMFEYNVRAASILGIVGAGGIGFYLYTYISNFQYDRAATALLFLLIVVTLIDTASSALRARLSQ